jgi:hypothetical protein
VTFANTGAASLPLVWFDSPVDITTPEDWKAAEASLNWLHDAVTRSLLFVNDARVLPDGSMEMAHGEAVLKVIVQTQNHDHPGAEVTFRGVQEVAYDSQPDVQPGEVSAVTTREGQFLRFRFGECDVLARTAKLTPLDWQQSEGATPES